MHVVSVFSHKGLGQTRHTHGRSVPTGIIYDQANVRLDLKIRMATIRMIEPLLYSCVTYCNLERATEDCLEHYASFTSESCGATSGPDDIVRTTESPRIACAWADRMWEHRDNSMRNDLVVGGSSYLRGQWMAPQACYIQETRAWSQGGRRWIGQYT